MSDTARNFDTLAREVFAPVYPVIARQILERTGIYSGRCLDVGCGPGYLGLALAEQSDLEITFFDQSSQMLDIVQKNIVATDIQKRLSILQGNVARIYMKDQSMNLVVSRGSVFFWDQLHLAFAEIYRVLAPRGKAMVGGGFGTAELRERIACEMEDRDRHTGQWREKINRNLSEETQRKCENALRQGQVPNFEVDLNAEAGLWVVMHK